MLNVNSNKSKIICDLVEILYDSIETCNDEIERTRLEVCKNGFQMYFTEDIDIAKKYLMFNKDIAEENLSEFIKKNKNEIDRIREDRIRESFYWIANNFDIIK